MEFNFYNISSRIILFALGFLPMLLMAGWMIVFGNTLAHILSILLFFLAAVFLYKIFCIKVIVDDRGLFYRSPLCKKQILWKDLHDILIVVRERRNTPDYYPFIEWYDIGNPGKSYFLLFRTTKEFPQNPMFMFSTPATPEYISLQYRKKLAQVILEYCRE